MNMFICMLSAKDVFYLSISFFGPFWASVCIHTQFATTELMAKSPGRRPNIEPLRSNTEVKTAPECVPSMRQPRYLTGIICGGEIATYGT